jgi:Chaperone of endosialidase
MPLPTLDPGGTNTASDTTISVYGTNTTNATTYALANVSVGTNITATKWTDLVGYANLERTRRGYGNATITGITVGSAITANTINYIKTIVSVDGPAADQAYNTTTTNAVTTYPQVTGESTGANVAIGDAITASKINSVIQSILNSGGYCTCNCNYCTCNCNYCTCNCNYACTCNCNYSDRRLKANIKLLDKQFDLNVYSFTYLWDKTKTYLGVMAQELIGTKYANALSIDAHGYYMVDYSKLPVKMKIQ